MHWEMTLNTRLFVSVVVIMKNKNADNKKQTELEIEIASRIERNHERPGWGAKC